MRPSVEYQNENTEGGNKMRKASSDEVPERLDINTDSEAGDDDAHSDDDIINRDQTFCQRLKSVIFNKNYLLVVTSVSFLYYIITGLQYWMSDYMLVVMKQKEAVVFVSFGAISITGPVLGVVVGGNITTKLGGYSTRKSL